ncbi:Putative DNA primase large subunit [Hirsutella minnesotensis 3608]|nr:Putative DNA primase large subunit [Hirsutella minnesotensis 3608]
MLRHDHNRVDTKRRPVIDHRKKQFATPQFKDVEYPYRLNFYIDPPTSDITLEQFEQWAIDRLRVLAELESSTHRNRTPAETAAHMKPILEKYLPLDTNSSASSKLFAQRQKDHYSHFILRLAFASTEDLRARFIRYETMLFRMRFNSDDLNERSAFVSSLDLDWWDPVTEDERQKYAAELMAMLGPKKTSPEDDTWFKVDWERVPDLVEQRRVFLRAGKAFVPGREQSSMVVADFESRLEKQLQLTARALPRLDEDDRLTPILNHLSKNFISPHAAYSSDMAAPTGAQMTASSVDRLSQHFPACMSSLHRTLRRDGHLKHFGRLQYTLFLKGAGLQLDEALVFWRSGFHKMTDDTFNKEYKYNVRHAYGDVGGDSNRRGNGYSPFSCDRIMHEPAPGAGQTHGCPYRNFDMDNLSGLLHDMGVTDRSVLQAVKEDKDRTRYHMACNRVFEHMHKNEIKRAKDEGIMTAVQLDTISHPNEYYKRSVTLKNLDKDSDVKMEES